MFSTGRRWIRKVLNLATEWPRIAALALSFAFAPRYRAGLTANDPVVSGRFQFHTGEDSQAPYEGFDTATGLQCLTLECIVTTAFKH
jgi:hypothetical protein